jgi:hypothetical protein
MKKSAEEKKAERTEPIPKLNERIRGNLGKS